MEPFLALSPNACSYTSCSCNTTRSPEFSHWRSGISPVWKSSTSRRTISLVRSPANFLSASTTFIFHQTPSLAWFQGVLQTWLSFSSSTSRTTSSPVSFGELQQLQYLKIFWFFIIYFFIFVFFQWFLTKITWLFNFNVSEIVRFFFFFFYLP